MRSLLFLALLIQALSLAAAEKIILDTDLGDDVDDAGTLAVLHALADRGDIEILAVGIVNGHVDAVPCADAINTWYGRPDLPLGTIKAGWPINHDRFNMGQVAAAYPHDLTKATAPEVVGLYRSILAAQPDHSVTLVVVGQATNVANLLKSQPDAHSPLDGVELMRRKIRFYAAGGNGRATLPSGQAGWNYQNDKAAAAYELTHLPSDFPTVFAGGSGLNIKVGSCYQQAAPDHIVRRLYENYFDGTARDRQTWDQLRLVYGALPGIRGWWNRSPNGNVTMDVATNVITWSATPDRNHSYAYVNSGDKPAVIDLLTGLMMYDPRGDDGDPQSSIRDLVTPQTFVAASPAWDRSGGYALGAAHDGDAGSETHAQSTGEEWIEYDFGAPHVLSLARIREDDGGNYSLGAWRLAWFDGSAWVDAFPLRPSATSAWQEVPLDGIVASRIRLYAIAPAGKRLEIYEFECHGNPVPVTEPLAINFQPADAAVPAGYLVDSGAAFGDRGGDRRYGWLGGTNPDARDRNWVADQAFDTLIHLQLSTPRTWEVELPPGTYAVHLVMGDPRYAHQTNHLAVEGIAVTDPDGIDLDDVYDLVVPVSDGRLTIVPGDNAWPGAKIRFIEIEPLPAGAG